MKTPLIDSLVEFQRYLASKAHLTSQDIEKITAAYQISEKAHEGQFRKSGESYIHHPLAVVVILGELGLDAQTLTAGLLHDVTEDTPVTKAEIAEQFGAVVAELVDGVSKLDKIKYRSDTHVQVENFRKMLLAMSRDVRVVLVKLADRLHNMRTLHALNLAKRKRISRETLEIYAPIANRLGLNPIYQELEDLSFCHLYPTRYRVLNKAVMAARGNRKEIVEKILQAIKQSLAQAKIEAEVTGREKHIYSIYKKMAQKTGTFTQVFDIYGFRVIVQDVASCYLALGALHSLYKPIPGKFKDYIAIPKSNGYQSLHTVLFGPFGTPVEIQIRSSMMHGIAEAGVAAHWVYKTSDDLSRLQQKTHQWVEHILALQKESTDSVEFLENFKIDLFPDEVYVFTPRGMIMPLPRGATAVDFAYAVHTDVGNSCTGVKINHEFAPLRSVLKNGDHVAIVTSPTARPNPSWLNYVVTGKARAQIRQSLKVLKTEDAAVLGERLLNQALRALSTGSDTEVDLYRWDKLLRHYGVGSKEEILTGIGLGKYLNVVVANQLLALSELSSESDRHTPGAVTIRGSEGVAVQFARCCYPVPGDAILGYINKGKGLIVHVHDCHAISKFRKSPDKWLDVEWGNNINRMFKACLALVVANKPGVLARIASCIAESSSNIDNVSVEDHDDSSYARVMFTVQVKDTEHLSQLMDRLRELPIVTGVVRERKL